MKKLLAGFVVVLVCAGICSANVVVPNEKDPSTIMMYGGVYNSDFFEFLKATSNPKIKHYTFILHSPGGDATTCIAIINRIREMQADGVKFTMKAYGLAMSAGSYIFMMGDERIIYDGAYLMWHTVTAQIKADNREYMVPKNAWVFFKGIDNYIRAKFKKATGLSDKWVEYWLDSGGAQFMSARTAYALGIATKFVE